MACNALTRSALCVVMHLHEIHTRSALHARVARKSYRKKNRAFREGKITLAKVLQCELFKVFLAIVVKVDVSKNMHT